MNTNLLLQIVSSIYRVSFNFIQCEARGESLAASATLKGSQVKTTEPMVSIKVTNCSSQLGWILARDGFAKYYMGSRPEAKKSDFFI